MHYQAAYQNWKKTTVKALELEAFGLGWSIYILQSKQKVISSVFGLIDPTSQIENKKPRF